MPDTMELVPTLSDVDRHPEIAMVANKPEIVIIQERNEIAAKLKRQPYIFVHARATGAGSDIVRRRPTTIDNRK